MRVHIIGIGGTFMAGVALIAQQLGFSVTGCDANMYPPMSDILSRAGIDVVSGYDAVDINSNQVDVVVVGNVISRGNPVLEHVLNLGIRYQSGPEFLFEHVLSQKQVLAVAGTHGKTTTTAMLTWILTQAGKNPGCLIGGVAHNFSSSAWLTDSPYFIIEADEYDTAFFDKRPKFMHYRPRTLVVNNIEFDHADIYPSLDAIEQQFQYLLRTVPADGTVVVNAEDDVCSRVINNGCWSKQSSFGLQHGDWSARCLNSAASEFDLLYQGCVCGTVSWSQIGLYNVQNALAAAAAAVTVGVEPETIIAALSSFAGVKCRMEFLGEVNGVDYFRDFAHHPTAIASAIEAMKSSRASHPVYVVLVLGSRTLQRHVNIRQLAKSLKVAKGVVLMRTEEVRWDVGKLASVLKNKLTVVHHDEQAVAHCVERVPAGSAVLILSNKSIGDLYERMALHLPSVHNEG